MTAISKFLNVLVFKVGPKLLCTNDFGETDTSLNLRGATILNSLSFLFMSNLPTDSVYLLSKMVCLLFLTNFSLVLLDV